MVTLEPPTVAVTSTVENKYDVGWLLFESLTKVLVPLLPPVVNALEPLTRLKLHVALTLAETVTVADAVALLNAVCVLDPLAGFVDRDKRDHTCVPPTHTELMTVLPMRISLMLVPPTAMGIVKS